MDEKFLKYLVALAVAVCCLTALVIATRPGPSGVDDGSNVAALTAWTLDDNGLLTISGRGPMPDYGYGESYYYEWPFAYGKGGEAYENPAPWGVEKDHVERGVIQDGVTNVGDYAFYDCARLTSVEIPDGVTKIGNGAFQDCTRLKRVTIPESVLYIGDGAFRNCDALTSVEIPDSVLHIGKNVFAECDALTNVVLSKCITVLEDSAFRGCTRLTDVAFPDKLEYIGPDVFRNCDTLTDVSIPDKVVSIGRWAFWNCDALQSVTFPALLRSIGAHAFAECENLASVTFPKELLPHNLMANPSLWIEGDAFRDCHALTSVKLPFVDGMMEIDDDAFPEWTTLS